jgi:hypothetical protein
MAKKKSSRKKASSKKTTKAAKKTVKRKAVKKKVAKKATKRAAPKGKTKSAPKRAAAKRATPRSSGDGTGKLLGWLGILCALTSLLVLPLVFGVVGLILGLLALHKGEKTLGWIAILGSVVLSLGSFLWWGARVAYAAAVVAAAVIF